jgi:ubiquinone/menaquinone biosynthesis C-methylase UbiE
MAAPKKATALDYGQERGTNAIKPAHVDAEKVSKAENAGFQIEDVTVFDRKTLSDMLQQGSYGLTIEKLAISLHGLEKRFVEEVRRKLPGEVRQKFSEWLHKPVSVNEVERTRRRLLDKLFWELTYWKTPELYEALTEGENLHPGIFKRLKPVLKDKIVLDAGAGTGRSTVECIKSGAELVYAVEPSPGLRRILKRKMARYGQSVVPMAGRFQELPLPDSSVDVALACSAFTADDEAGGETGLDELRRVTRPGGKIVIIWPREQDRHWFAEHNFKYEALPANAREMKVHFRNLETAKRCVRYFYNKNRAAMNHLLRTGRPELPFDVLGFNPPVDYCWLDVDK